MKKIILILFLLIELFINEFTLAQLAYDKQLGIDNIIKIRFFNLIIFITWIIIFFYYSDFVKVKPLTKVLILIIYIALIDFFSGYVNFGYPRHEKDSLRFIFPYDWIRGEPNKYDHNKFGFRGNSPDIERDTKNFIIGIFGGSTGYAGNPSIIEILSKNLKEDSLDNIVFNFSSVSSNHNQHIHRLLEFYEYKYDLIIFYGGWNETAQQYYYDSRPGYPYNFFLHDSDANKDINFLMKKSNIIGELDKLFNLYQTFNPKTSNEEDFKKWMVGIKKNYFDTINKGKDISENMITPNKCKKTSFLPIFQPYDVSDKRVESLLNFVKNDLQKNNIYDFGYLKEKLIFVDQVHIDQKSKEIIANEILLLVKEIFENKNIC